MKNAYQAPTIRVRNLHVEEPILAGSGLNAGDQQSPSVGNSKSSLPDDYEDENNVWYEQ